jgi:hypothetical protein
MVAKLVNTTIFFLNVEVVFEWLFIRYLNDRQ